MPIEITWFEPLISVHSLTHVHCEGPGIYFADTLGDLRAVGASLCNRYAFMYGYTTKNDGLGGEFFWDRTSTATDDAVSVINPNGNAGVGRWIKRL